jgi:cation transport ATPase
VRYAAASVFVLLVTAAPAVALPGGYGVSTALHSSPLGVGSSDAANNKSHSCQAGDRSAQMKRAGRKTFVVACEQPPRSNLITPDSVAKATAAALSVLG